MASERMINAMQALQTLGDTVAVPMKGGKSYVMVKDRIEIFRKEFGDEYGIDTDIIANESFEPGSAVMASAKIIDRNHNVIASGWAVEFVGSTKLTEASPVEIAETSAIGRALACFGLAGGEYASLNEMEAHGRKTEFRAGALQQQARTGNGPPHPQPPNRAGPYGSVDQGLVKQAERNRQPPPPSQWYVPDGSASPQDECQNVVYAIESIRTTHELGRYWSDLKPALEVFKAGEFGPDLIAEIKAAFATQHNSLGAQR